MFFNNLPQVEINALFLIYKIKNRAPAPCKPLSNSSLLGTLPHPLYFTKTSPLWIPCKVGYLSGNSGTIWWNKTYRWLFSSLFPPSWSVGFDALLILSNLETCPLLTFWEWPLRFSAPYFSLLLLFKNFNYEELDLKCLYTIFWKVTRIHS